MGRIRGTLRRGTVPRGIHAILRRPRRRRRARLFLHRVAAFRDADDPGAHRLPTDASATRTDSAASGLGLHPTSPSPPPAWAVPAAACLALAASVSVPSFAGFPYFFVVVAGATLYGAETHDPLTPLSARRIRNAARRRRGWFARWRGGDANRRGGGVASGLRVAPAISRGFLRAALGYVATHFSLLYLYQLPELTARADGVRAKWLGLYVLAETDRPTVTALKLTQLVALAGLYACLCAAGAMRGGDDDDSRPRRRAGSARAIIPPLGGGVRREDDGLEAPLLDGGDGCDVSSVEPSLVSEEDDGDAPWAPRVARPVDDFGPESVFADAHDDDLDGARMEDDARSAFSGAETRRAAPIPVPSVPRRLLAKYTGTLASFVIVATSLAAKNLLAYPVLAYALVSITSRPKHGAFARRHGPLMLVYLAVWCVTEYAYISVPDAVLPEATHRRGQLLRAVGLYRVDADRADAAGPGYIGSLFVTLAAAAALLNQARMTPTEEELEEALRAVGGGGLPPGFVRLDAADDDKPPPPATFERGDDADARGGAAEEAAAYASASANGGTAEEVAAAAYASANAAAARRGRRANVVEPAVPGWERPALAVLSNLLVPLALWIVALSNDDLLHAALLLAFLLTLVWPGDRSVLANTGRVIAGGLALMYLWSLDSIPDLTGINRPEWKPALRLLGLWQPDLIRAMIPMACILVINCVVLNLPEVVEALQPLEDEDAEAEAGIAARTAGTATARAETEGVTAEAVWALVSAAAAEVWLTAVALADGGGAYGVLLLGLCIVEVTDCCLLNLALLGLLGFALIVPMPSNPKDERNSPRWRALLGFALANLAARYAFGAYPLARSLGLSEPAQRFLHRTVGLAPNLPRNELMSQLLGPSALVIVTHFHRVGALSSASFGGEVGGGFGVGSSGSGGRPVPLPVASNQTGVFPFLRRVAVLHSGKVLTLAALYFSVRHVDVFGAAMLAGAGALCVASKTAAAPAEILGGIAVATAFANYALAVRWMHDEALIHQNILEWVGLRRWDPPRQMFWPKHEEMLRGAVLVLAALELARASRAWFAELPPALKTGCAPEPCHLFWPVPGASAVERGFRVKDKRVKGRGGGRGRGEGEEGGGEGRGEGGGGGRGEGGGGGRGEGGGGGGEERGYGVGVGHDRDRDYDEFEATPRRGDGTGNRAASALEPGPYDDDDDGQRRRRRDSDTSLGQLRALASFAPGYLEGALAWSMPGAIYATFAAVAVASANVVSLVYLGLAALLMESKLSDSPRRRARRWKMVAGFCAAVVLFQYLATMGGPPTSTDASPPPPAPSPPHRRRVRPRRRPRRDRRRRSARPPRRRRPRRDRRDPRDRRGRRTRRPRRRRRRRRTSNVRTRSTSDRPSNRTSRRGVFSGRTNPFRRRRRRTAIARRDGWRWRRGRARSSSGIFSRFSSPRRNFAWTPRSPTPRRRSIEPPRSTTTTNDRGSAQARVLRSNPGRAWTRRFSARFRLAEARFRARHRDAKSAHPAVSDRPRSRRERLRAARLARERDVHVPRVGAIRRDSIRSRSRSRRRVRRGRVHPRRASRRLPRARALSPATARRRPRPPRRTLQVPQILQHIRHRRRVGEPGARRRRVGRRVRADLARVRRVAHPRRRGMDVGDENRARVRRGSTRRRSDHLRGVLRGSRAVGIARAHADVVVMEREARAGARAGAAARRARWLETQLEQCLDAMREREERKRRAEEVRAQVAKLSREVLELENREGPSGGGIGEAIREWEAENTADEEATATATADRAAISRASEEATATATADRAAVSRASEDATATATADRAAVSRASSEREDPRTSSSEDEVSALARRTTALLATWISDRSSMLGLVFGALLRFAPWLAAPGYSLCYSSSSSPSPSTFPW